MDLKEWVKTAEDDRTVTMTHPKGHTMTVALKSLPKIQAEQIKRLKFAHGGGVSEQGKDVRFAKKTGSQESMEMAKEEAKGRAKEERLVKPKIKGLADGGTVSADEPKPSSAEATQQDQPDPSQGVHININAAPAAQAPAPVVAAAVPQPVTQASAPPQMLGSRDATPPPDSSQYQSEQQLAPLPKPKGSGLQQEAQKTLNAFQQEKQANQLQAEAQTKQAEAGAQIEAERIGRQQDYEKNVQQHYNEVAQHAKEFEDHIKTVDPDRYLHSKGTGSKIATGLGLFLGGLSVPFGGHNYASDFIDKQIQHDMEAQRQDNENKKSIWGAYNDLYKNANVADSLTLASLNDLTKQKASLVAQKIGTLQAQQNLLRLNSQLDQKSHDERIKAAGILSGGYQNPSQAPSGDSTAPSQGPGKKTDKGAKAENPNVYKLLAPGAEGKYQQIMGGLDPLWSPKAEIVNQQYTQAQQIEKVLNGPKNDGEGGVSDLFDKMYKDVGAGKTPDDKGFEHIRRNIGNGLDAIPYVGHAVHNLDNLVRKGSDYQEYENSRNGLKADLATALTGLIPPSEIDSMIENYLPQYRDTPQDIQRKKQALVNTIMKAARGSSLSATGMLRK